MQSTNWIGYDRNIKDKIDQKSSSYQSSSPGKNGSSANHDLEVRIMNDITQTRKRKKGAVKRNYKDTLFIYLFGRNKEFALSLYNAISGSDHKDPNDIQFNTIDDFICLGRKTTFPSSSTARSTSMNTSPHTLPTSPSGC